MSYVKLIDGRKINLTNDQAFAIYQVLHGQAEPANEQQAAFCLTVADVHLAGGVPVPKDEQLDIILHDDSLYGLKKAKAVAERLKTRGKL